MNPAPRSALYLGAVMHRRLKPMAHYLRYRVFYLFLDLEEIDALATTRRFFSRNRFNLFSFHDRDYGDGSGQDLRRQVTAHLRGAGIEIGDGVIQLLTLPRILGYAFNPLSIYYCHRPDGALAAILYEVNNTFGQRHAYLIPVTGNDDQPIRQHSAKAFYVSPFLTLDLNYDFTLSRPSDSLAVGVTASDAQGPIIVTALTAKRQALTDRTLLRAFFAYPLLTLKVIGGIHWEALRLWLKGAKLQHRPAPPAAPVSLGYETQSVERHAAE